MRIRRTVPIWALTLLLLGSAAVAQDLEAEYLTESQLLERELDRYIEARDRERQAISRLRDVARMLDDALADPNAAVSEMRALERDLTAARQSAVRRLEDSSQARQQMYDRMDRLFGLAGEMEQRPPEAVDEVEEGADGLWQFQFRGVELSALVELEFQPSGLDRTFQAVGTYRTSNGHNGRLQGNFFGTRLQLEVLDSRRGKVAVLDGNVGADGRLQGTWQSVETGLARDDRRSGGLWSGHRIASESEFELD